MRHVAVVGLLVACGGDGRPPVAAPPPPPGPTLVASVPDAAAPEPDAAAPEPAPALPDAPTAEELPLPEEPWYRKQAQRYDECVEPLPDVPARHFPAPFASCDPHVESFTSPPGGPELHFHYRDFSPALTRAHRKTRPGTCCYMIFEFPRRSR